jgi:hypothetical protein
VAARALGVDGSESFAIQRGVGFGGSGLDFNDLIEPPRNLQPTGSGVGIAPQFSWDAVPGASFYIVELENSNIDWIIIVPAGTNPGFTLPDLTGTPVEEFGLSLGDVFVEWDVQAIVVPNADFNSLDQDTVRRTFTHMSDSRREFFSPAVLQTALYGAAHLGRDGMSILHEINPLTGATTLIGPIGFERVSGMAFNVADGKMYATGERADGSNTHVLLTINLATGAGTEVGPTNVTSLGFGDTISDISFRNADGALYAYLEAGDAVGIINLATGAATALGRSNVFGCCGNGIAFAVDDTLYHANDINLHTLNQTTGVATIQAPLGFSPPADLDPRINAMDFHPLTGQLFASLNDGNNANPENHLALIDKLTGVVSIIGPTVPGLDAIAWVFALD